MPCQEDAIVLATVAGSRSGGATLPPSQTRWPAGDEIGMANNLGTATGRVARRMLADPKAKSYEVSHIRSNTMPQSPFGTPLVDKYRPTVGIPGTRHAFNGEETVSGEAGAQGTQMDALGHFAVLPEAWDGKSEFPSGRATYYGGYTQQQVKPSRGLAVAEARYRQGAADRHHCGAARRQDPSRQGQARCSRAQLVTAADIEAMLKAQGLGHAG